MSAGQPTRRVSSRFSAITGVELRKKIYIDYEVTNEQFARVAGITTEMVKRWVSGQWDGRIPAWLDLILEYGDLKPEIWKRGIRRAPSSRVSGRAESLHRRLTKGAADARV